MKSVTGVGNSWGDGVCWCTADGAMTQLRNERLVELAMAAGVVEWVGTADGAMTRKCQRNTGAGDGRRCRVRWRTADGAMTRLCE